MKKSTFLRLAIIISFLMVVGSGYGLYTMIF